jgi:hypothetical protein
MGHAMIKTFVGIVTLIVVVVPFVHFATAHPAITAVDPFHFAGLLLATVSADFDDPALTAREAAGFYGLSLPAFWRGVAAGHISKPFYPLPRTPRWRLSWLQQAEANRMLPAQAKELRRQAKLARERAKKTSTSTSPQT